MSASFIFDILFNVKLFTFSNLFNNNFIPFNLTFIYFIKFIIAISCLIFIRTGVPRYRYDYLTKLGWIKFLMYTLSFLIFLITLMLIY